MPQSTVCEIPFPECPYINIPCAENWDEPENNSLNDEMRIAPCLNKESTEKTLIKTEPKITNTYNDYWSIEALKQLNLNPKVILKVDSRPDFQYENLIPSNYDHWRGKFERKVTAKDMTTIVERYPATTDEDQVRFNVSIPKENPTFFDAGTQTEITGNRYEGGCPDLKRKYLFENFQLYEQSYLLPHNFPKLYKTENECLDYETPVPGKMTRTSIEFHDSVNSQNLNHEHRNINKRIKRLVAFVGTEREGDDPGFLEENVISLVPFVPRFDHKRNVELITEMNHARLRTLLFERYYLKKNYESKFLTIEEKALKLR